MGLRAAGDCIAVRPLQLHQLTLQARGLRRSQPSLSWATAPETLAGGGEPVQA